MKYKKIMSRYWLKHFCDKKTTLCKLCGNTGVIETNPKSPTGYPLGKYVEYCICPNGRAMRGE